MYSPAVPIAIDCGQRAAQQLQQRISRIRHRAAGAPAVDGLARHAQQIGKRGISHAVGTLAKLLRRYVSWWFRHCIFQLPFAFRLCATIGRGICKTAISAKNGMFL